jgi:hypothetical protein
MKFFETKNELKILKQFILKFCPKNYRIHTFCSIILNQMVIKFQNPPKWDAKGILRGLIFESNAESNQKAIKNERLQLRRKGNTVRLRTGLYGFKKFQINS